MEMLVMLGDLILVNCGGFKFPKITRLSRYFKIRFYKFGSTNFILSANYLLCFFLEKQL